MSKKYCNKRNIAKKEKQNNIFCINLEERIDRWVKVKEEVKKLGNNYKLIRVNAIKHKTPQYGLILTLAKLVKYAKKKNLKYIHFIEDDLLLHSDAFLWCCNSYYFHNAVVMSLGIVSRYFLWTRVVF